MTKQLILNSSSSFLENSSFHMSGSKSISQRALIINFLGSSSFDIINLSNSKDTYTLNEILKEIGKKKSFNVGQGGTTFRFLLPLLSLIDKEFYINGHTSLESRPLSRF